MKGQRIKFHKPSRRPSPPRCFSHVIFPDLMLANLDDLRIFNYLVCCCR
jgi:hypothetical protein